MKKFLTCILLLFAAFALAGCELLGGGSGGNGGTINIDVDLDDVFLNVSASIPNKDNITEDMELPKNFGSVEIQWQSSNEIVITSRGKVARPDTDTEVILTCKLTSGSQTKTYEIKVTVKAKEVINVSTIAAIKSSALGETYKLRGTVVAVSAINFIVKDETGYIVSYFQDGIIAPVRVGEILEVVGNTSAYGGGIQLNAPTYTLVGRENVVYPEVDEISASDFDGLNQSNITIQFLKVKGKIVKSGSYYNFTVEGATYTGSIATPATDLSGYLDKTCYISGYFAYVSGGRYLYVVYTNIEAAEDTPVVTPASTISEVLAKEVNTSCKVEASVVGLANNSIVLKDSTGMILVYNGDNNFANIALGDMVEVSGVVGTHNNVKQINSPTIEVKSHGTASLGNPSILDKDTFASLAASTNISFVQIEGILRKSGNYVNLEVEGTTLRGSILANGEDYTSLFDKKVVVQGLYVYASGSSTRYANILVTNVTLSADQGGTTLTESTIAQVKAGEVGTTYLTHAVVVATSAQSVLVKDSTGYIYIYLGSEYNKELAAGEKIEIKGATSTYNNAIQFNRPEYKKEGVELVDYPSSRAIKATDIDALISATTLNIEYVSVEGKLEIKGNNINLVINGTDNQVNAIYPDASLAALNGKNVKLEGFVVYKSVKDSVNFVNIIYTGFEELETPPVTLEPVPIAQVIKGEEGATYKVQATIIAVSNTSLLLEDATGKILAYFASGISEVYKAGETVEAVGTTAKYGGAMQLVAPSITRVGTAPVSYPEVEVLTVEEFNALKQDNINIQYVSFVGTLAISGNYINVSVAGTGLIGSILPSRENLSAFDGKMVKVSGYFVHVSGSNMQYLGFFAIRVEEYIQSDTEKFEALKAEILALNGQTLYTSTVFKTQDGEFSITYASSAPDVLDGSGKLHNVTSDTTVTMRVTITDGNLTEELTINILVKMPVSIETLYALESLPQTQAVKAYVLAKDSKGFVLYDGMYIYVYAGSNTMATLTVGDEIIVVGEVKVYNGILEYSKINSYEITGNHIEPEFMTFTMTGEAVDALMETPAIIPITTKGKLAVSRSGNNTYYNITVPGATATVSPTAAEGYDELDGKDIIFKGFVLYPSGKYLKVITISMEEDEDVEYHKLTLEYNTEFLELVSDHEDLENIKFGDKVRISVNKLSMCNIGQVFLNDEEISLEEDNTYTFYMYADTTITVLLEGEEEDDKVTISEILAGSEWSEYKTRATIVAMSNTSLVLSDSTGLIQAYFEDGFAGEEVIGDVVDVTGVTSFYGGAMQFVSPQLEKIEHIEVTYPEERILTSVEFTNLRKENITVEYVSFVGTLHISGEYLNVSVAGSTLTGSILASSTDLSALDGKSIKVSGYFINVTGGSGQYLSIVATEVMEYEMSASEKLEDIKAQLATLDKQYLYTSTHLKTQEGEFTITWESTNPSVLDEAGKVTSPETDTRVTLSATITNGTLSDSVRVTLIVKAPGTIASLYDLEYLPQTRAVKGIVCAKDSKSFMLCDDGAFVYVYCGATMAANVNVGDEMVLVGDVKYYNGALEFSLVNTYEVIGNTETVALEFSNIYAEDIERLMKDFEFMPVLVKGKLEISETEAAKYYNIIVPGTEVIVSLTASSGFDELAGKYVVLSGFVVYPTSNYLKVIAFAMEEVELDTRSLTIDIDENYLEASTNQDDLTAIFYGDKVSLSFNKIQDCEITDVMLNGELINPTLDNLWEFYIYEDSSIAVNINTDKSLSINVSEADAPVNAIYVYGYKFDQGEFADEIVSATLTDDYKIICEFESIMPKYFIVLELAEGEVELAEDYTNIYRESYDMPCGTDKNILWANYGTLDEPHDLAYTATFLDLMEFNFVTDPHYYTAIVEEISTNEYNDMFAVLASADGYKINAYDIKDETYSVQLNASNTFLEVGDEITFAARLQYTDDELGCILQSVVVYMINGEHFDVSVDVSFNLRTPKLENSILFVCGYKGGQSTFVVAHPNEDCYEAKFTSPQDYYQVFEYVLEEGEELDYSDYVSSSEFFENGAKDVVLHYFDEFTLAAKYLDVNEDGSWTIHGEFNLSDYFTSPSITITDIVAFGYLNGETGESLYQENTIFIDDSVTVSYSVNGKVFTFVATIPKELVDTYTKEYYFAPSYKGGIAVSLYVELTDGEYNYTSSDGYALSVYFFNSFLDSVETEGDGTIESPLTVEDAYNIAEFLPDGIYTKEYFYIEGTVATEVTSDYANFSIGEGESAMLVYGLSTYDYEYYYGSAFNKVEGIPVEMGDKVLICAQIYRYMSKTGAITLEFQNAGLIKVNDEEVTYELIPEITETAAHAGTQEDPFDAKDAILEASKLDAATKEMSKDKYFIKATIATNPTSDYCNFNFVDGEDTIVVYGLSQDADFTQRYGTKREIETLPVKNGDTVILLGYLQNYSGTLEISKAQLIEIVTE